MKEKAGFLTVYKDFWKRAFDYRGLSTLREYWLPVGFHLGLSLFLVIYYLLADQNGWSPLPFWIVLVFLLVGLIPFVALTVRRLRDTGLSGLWALLLLFVGVGTCVVMALCAAGSGFTAVLNTPVNLYGPPPMESTFDPESNVPDDLYGPPATDFESSENVPEPLYGPPETDFDPSENQTPTLYGPPPTEFDSTDNTAAPLYGPPPTELDPSENIAEPLYGPPPTTYADR